MSAYNGPRHHAADAARRKWQNPEAILADIGLKPGLTFLDIGCGGGFFTLPAARLVGSRGKVYGLDSDEQSISELAALAAQQGLENLKAVAGKAEEVILCEGCADIVFFGIVLHDFQDAGKVLQNARKMIKPAGRLVNLDWKKEPMEIGPPPQKKFSAEYAAGLIEAAGFSVAGIRDAGTRHYLIIARPSVLPEKQ